VLIAAVSATAVARGEGYVNVDLYSLGGFAYWSPKPADVKAGKPFKSTIPDKIKGLDGKRVRIEGFMIPFDQAASQVTEFMLVASYDSCGFGDMPSGMNEWVYVRLPKGRTTHYTVIPVVVSGLLRVGEEFDNAGYVTSIFRLEADHVSGS
jgi:hypothetical protein